MTVDTSDKALDKFVALMEYEARYLDIAYGKQCKLAADLVLALKKERQELRDEIEGIFQDQAGPSI